MSKQEAKQYEHPIYIQESRMNMFPPFKESVFYTPKILFSQGIVICDTCGTEHSIDKKFCQYCGDWIMILMKKEKQTN